MRTCRRYSSCDKAPLANASRPRVRRRATPRPPLRGNFSACVWTPASECAGDLLASLDDGRCFLAQLGEQLVERLHRSSPSRLPVSWVASSDGARPVPAAPGVLPAPRGMGAGRRESDREPSGSPGTTGGLTRRARPAPRRSRRAGRRGSGRRVMTPSTRPGPAGTCMSQARRARPPARAAAAPFSESSTARHRCGATPSSSAARR